MTALSVIVTTYNRPGHLERCLAGLARQEFRDFEVIVADDGSSEETAECVAEFARQAPVRVEHVWQVNEGFRAARIRNLGIHASRGERIVFLDGDCVPLSGFLAAHARALGSDRVLAGTRLFLDRAPSAELTLDAVRGGRPHLDELRPELRGVRWLAAKDRVYRHVFRKERPKVVTANLSVSRRALNAVNGLDERFVGWGYEDDDLRRRLLRRGFSLHSVYSSAHVCHLWHEPVQSFTGRSRDSANTPYYRRGYYLARCRNGLVQRPMESCSVAWNGHFVHDRAAELSVAWGAHPRWQHAEVRVYVVADAHQRLPRGRHPHVVLAPPGTETVNGELRGIPVVTVPRPLNAETDNGRQQVLDAIDGFL